MAFDPDVYAADAPALAFDPDAYVGESRKRLDGASPTKWSQKLGEGMLPGFNRAAAAVQAAVDPIIPGRTDEWGQDYRTRYTEHLRANQHQSAQTQREAPIPSVLLQTVGALPTAVAAGPATAGQATLLGGAYGAGDSQGRDPEEILADTMLGAGGGRAAAELPHAFLGAENAVRRGARLVMPKINPTPAAQRLMAEGIPLTAGQMNPDSTFAHIEEASSHNPLGLQAEREAAKDAARNLAIRRAVAPGARPPASGTVQQRLRAVYEGFGPAYQQFREIPVPGDSMASLPDAAAVPRKGIDARTAGAAKAEIENALTVLGPEVKPSAVTPSGLLDAHGAPILAPEPPPAAPRQGTVGDLVKVRENLRDGIRSARSARDYDRLNVLGHAEDVVTNAIESAMTPEQQAALRNIDRQYSRYMTLEDAASRAGPESEFGPRQFSAAVAKSAGRRSFVQGRAGADQRLAQDMASTFDQRVPPTGMRGVVLSGAPKFVFGPAARFVNIPEVRAGLLPGGSFTLPTAGPVPGPQMSLTPQAAAMADVLRRRIALTPATAEDDRSP